jgi:hypothetical protein
MTGNKANRQWWGAVLQHPNPDCNILLAVFIPRRDACVSFIALGLSFLEGQETTRGEVKR